MWNLRKRVDKIHIAILSFLIQLPTKFLSSFTWVKIENKMKIQKTLDIISFFDFKLVYLLKLGSQTYLILADIVLLVIRIAFLSKHFKKICYSIHFKYRAWFCLAKNQDLLVLLSVEVCKYYTPFTESYVGGHRFWRKRAFFDSWLKLRNN